MNPTLVTKAALPRRLLTQSTTCRAAKLQRVQDTIHHGPQSRRIATARHARPRPRPAVRRDSISKRVSIIQRHIPPRVLLYLHIRLPSGYSDVPRDQYQARPAGPLQGPWRRQECDCQPDQEGILRPRQEVPPGHEQGPYRERQVRRDPDGLRAPLRPEEARAV